MQEKNFGLSNGYVFHNVFSKFKLLKQFVQDVYDFDLSGYHFIHSEFDKVTANECTLTLTNGKRNVLIEMKTKKLDGLNDSVVFFTNDIGSIMYEKARKKYPTIILGSRRYL